MISMMTSMTRATPPTYDPISASWYAIHVAWEIARPRWFLWVGGAASA